MIRAGLVTITAVTLIAASIIGAGFTILSPALSLSGSTNVTWGESIHLCGSHFIPGSSVVLTLDGTTPLYYTSVDPATRAGFHYQSGVAEAWHPSKGGGKPRPYPTRAWQADP